jgi:hypothetical protein
MDDFEKFWAVWPKKCAKADARKAWSQIEKYRPPIDKLCEIVLGHCKTEQWMQDGGKYIPYPATWLRGERWEDELVVKLPGVVNEKPWHETASGIETKGKELGLLPDQFESFPHFRAAVMRAAMKAA